LVPSTGFVTKELPLQTVFDIAEIEGVGLTVSVIVNTTPTQLPVVGVTE
jgi:hypothetical protein